MNIDLSVSSDDNSSSTCEYSPEIQTGSTCLKRLPDEIQAYDDCVDLTQDECPIRKPFVVGGSSEKSFKDSNGQCSNDARPSTPHSDSTVDLQPEDIDNDEIFDQMFPNTPNKRDTGASVSTNSSQSAVNDIHCDLVHSARLDSGQSQASVSSGYCSGEKKSGVKENAQLARQAKAAEREREKQKQAEERKRKQMASEVNKVYKPGECTKYMNIEVHPDLLSKWYMLDLPREVEALGARVLPVADIFHQGLVMWSRRVQQTFVEDGGQASLSPAQRPCSHSLLIQTADEVAAAVTSHTLTQHVANIKNVLDTRLCATKVPDPAVRSKRKYNNPDSKFNELQLEMAFTDLLISTGCDAMVTNSASELAMIIAQITKAIAEAPHKLAKRALDEQADYYMRGDNKKCVSVDKDGHGTSRLWQQMLAILPMSSLETSRAIAAKYPSPLTLYDALREPNGVSALADIVPSSRARRLGPEAANRLKTLLTATDGDMLIE